MAMEARNRTVKDWFSWINDGFIMLPRFQRFEAWSHSQVEGILENILREPALPVGALLTLEIGDRPPFHARPIVGAPKPSGKTGHHLLDGQQRLTALWRSLNDDYEDVTFFVAISDAERSDIDVDNPEVRSERRYVKRGERYPKWCDDPVQVWERNLIPVAVLTPGKVPAHLSKTIFTATGRSTMRSRRTAIVSPVSRFLSCLCRSEPIEQPPSTSSSR